MDFSIVKKEFLKCPRNLFFIKVRKAKIYLKKIFIENLLVFEGCSIQISAP